VDAGPVVLGFGVTATAFTLGASRIHGDVDAFRALYATADLFGAPRETRGGEGFATGGALGDAILFAMLTAPPLAEAVSRIALRMAKPRPRGVGPRRIDFGRAGRRVPPRRQRERAVHHSSTVLEAP